MRATARNALRTRTRPPHRVGRIPMPSTLWGARSVGIRANGLLPPIGWGTVDAVRNEAVFDLESGEISAPFESGGNWRIGGSAGREGEAGSPVGKRDDIARIDELEAGGADSADMLLDAIAVVHQHHTILNCGRIGDL